MTPSAVLCLSPTSWQPGQHRIYQLLTGLAAARRVHVLEATAQRSRLAMVGARRVDAVTVLTPYLPSSRPTRTARPTLTTLVEPLLALDGADMPMLWVCNADSLPLVNGLRISAVIYDCPARLDRNGPRRTAPREAALLERADLVLAGDPRDADRLARRHGNVHTVPDPTPRAPWSRTVASVRALLDRLEPASVALETAPLAIPPNTWFENDKGSAHGLDR